MEERVVPCELKDEIVDKTSSSSFVEFVLLFVLIELVVVVVYVCSKLLLETLLLLLEGQGLSLEELMFFNFSNLALVTTPIF